MLLGLSCILGSGSMVAQSVGSDTSPERSFEEELTTPAIPAKQLKKVIPYMERQLRSLPRLEGSSVEIVNDYMIRYTIPASVLFEPNGFDLTDRSNEYLAPVLNFLRHHGKYKVILAMHTDDTGSDSYLKILCENRILSLYDFFDSKMGNHPLVFGFAMGKSRPLGPNNSFKSRAANRRLEIYIIPGPTFLNDIKK